MIPTRGYSPFGLPIHFFESVMPARAPRRGGGSAPVLRCGGLLSSKVSLCSACCSGVSFACCFGFIFVYCSGMPVARSAGISVVCCSEISSFPLDCSSTCVIRECVCTLEGGTTGFSSSSDHSITVALRVRVVWSPPSEMLPGLRGEAVAFLLFF